MRKETIVFTTCGFLLGLILGGMIIGPKVYELQHRAQPAASAPDIAPASSTVAAPPQAGGSPATMQMVLARLGELKQKLAASPRDVPTLVELGNMYQDASKYPEAIEFYERAEEVRPDANVLTDLGICYRSAGQPEKALDAFRRAVRVDPSQWQALFNEAVVLYDLKQAGEAKTALAEVERIHPGDPDVAAFAKTLEVGK